MWQQNKTTVRWFAYALVLGLVAACSEVGSPERPETMASSPSIVQPETTLKTSPSPAPSVFSGADKESSATRATKQSAPTATTLPDQPGSSASSPSTPKSSSSDSLQPSFRAQPRLAGFSTDGRHFIYLESSRDTGAGIPKSSLQVIDVSSSHCVESGCIETRYGETDANLDVKEAEDSLLKQTWKMRQELKLTPPAAGIELPIISRSRAPDGTETVMLRLHDSDATLKLRLRQKRTSGEAEGKAAMQLEVNYNGQQRSLGSLANFKDSVLDYSIRQVRLSPDGKRVAVLITAAKPTFEGTLGTTLVQGFEL